MSTIRSFMRILPDKNETRTIEQIIEHYEVEKRLANQLRNASREERLSKLNKSLHEELFRLVPHHPLLNKKQFPVIQKKKFDDHMILLRRLLNKNMTFLEIGPGDCSLSFEVSKHVKEVYAVDVNDIITKSSVVPENFKLFISDGCTIPVPDNTIDIIYSNHLMEHLHSDDAYDQLKNIYRALSLGSAYLCITPSRLNGPHDISKYFDLVATGFHLKEYTVTELSQLFHDVGFTRLKNYIRVKGRFIRIPLFPAIICESILERLPLRVRQQLANTRIVRAIIGIRLIGFKDRNNS